MKKNLLLLSLLVSFFNNHAQEWTEIMARPDANFYDIQQAFNTYWETHDKTERSRGYKVFKRWEYMVAPRVYPSGDLSLLTKNAANFEAFTAANSQSSNYTPTSKTIGSSAMIASSTWSLVGPLGAMTGSAVNGLPRKAGRDNFITFHPTSSLSSTYWAGAPAGGLWKTTNNGTSWTTNTDNLSVIGCSDLAIDPTNPNIMYLATGDGDAGDCNSIGVLKSTNGGATWSSTGLSFNVNNYYRIRRLIIHPTNPQVLLAATNGGIYRTANGGTSWTAINLANTYDLEFKPGDPSTIYASGTTFSLSTSTGTAFTLVSAGIPTVGCNRMAIAVTSNSAGANYVYVVASSNSSSGLLGVYRSVNSGVTFSTMATSPDLLANSCAGTGSGGQGWYDLAIAASPLNANEVVVGGVNHWRSLNGGSSWTNIGCWNSVISNPPYVHADVHDLKYNSAGVLYSANDGGISEYTGSSWIDHVQTGTRNIAQIYRIGLSGTSANYWITGHQDNGSNIYNGTTYNASYPGDGLDCFVDRTNNNNLFTETPYGGLVRSTNGGTSWLSANSGITGNSNWLCPWKQDPQTANTIYAGFNTIWKSSNLGVSWTSLSALTTTAGSVIEFAVAPTNSLVMYVLKSNNIMKTINGGTNWTDVTGTLPVGSADPTYVAIDATDPNTAWVTFSGYSAANKVFMTTNGGTSWSNVTSNLPNLPANCIVYEPGTNDRVYVGMDIGVYYKDNSSTNWTLYNTGLPNTVISDLEISPAAPGKLRAATYGRGVYEVDVVTCATNPTVVTSANVTICPTSSATLTASGASTYSWSTGSTSSLIVVTPTAAVTVYTVTGSVSNCTNTKTVSVTLSSGVNVNITSNPTVLCRGNSATLTASGASSFLWNTGATTTIIIVSPTVTTSYSVTGTLGGCTGNALRTLTVIPTPTVTASSNQTICAGSSAIITASGASTYSWSNGATSSSVSVTPSINTVYTVTGTNGSCSQSKTVSITLSPGIIVSISASSSTLCRGNSVTLNAMGANSFLWSTGSTATSIVVSPTTTMTYSVLGTLGACTGSALRTLTVIPSPTVTVSSNQTVCVGSSAIITATGASTYSWSNGATSGSINVTPTINTVYTVTGTIGSCSQSKTVSITLTPGITVSISASSSTLCNGNSVTLNASGANSFLWNTGSTATTIVVSPTATTTYSVVGTLGACSGSALKTITVNAVPSLSVNNQTICPGNAATLIASGATTYTWNTLSNSNSITVSPSLTTIYTVSGSILGCASSKTVSVVIGGSLSISVNSIALCSGNSGTLTATGATTYSWSNGSTASTAVVSPSTTTIYTVMGLNGSCVGTKTVNVLVNPSPTVSLNASPGNTVCIGSQAVLSASGGCSYTWQPGNLNSSSITVTPTSATIYTVITNCSGCVGSKTIGISAQPGPSLTISANNTLVCSGTSVTLTANGASTYSWSTGSSASSIVVTPTANSVYTLYGSNGSCVSSKTIGLTFVATPTVGFCATTPSMCQGGSFTFVVCAVGALTYSYSGGLTPVGGSLVASPGTTTTYSITGSNGNCISNTGVVTLTVLPAPTITALAAPSSTLCTGGSASLTASGANSYSWSNGALSASTVVSPTATIIYTVTGSNSNGCSSTKTIAVVVSGAGITPSISASQLSICNGGSATLTASGASSYTWSTGSNASAIVVSPSVSTNYSVSGSNASCSGSSNISLSVTSLPTLSVNDQTICPGGTATLSVSGASGYTWSTGANGSFITVSPVTNTSYVVYGNNANCVSSATVNVTIGSSLSVLINSNPSSLCAGGSSTLTASGATTYSWNTGSTSATIVTSPTTTSNYTVIGLSGSCTGTAVSSISISPQPTLTINSSPGNTLCSGASATLTAAGAATYSWSTGATGNQIVITPTSNAFYQVIGSNSGCSNSASVSITVGSGSLNLNVSASPSVICSNGSSTIFATGATSYSWSNGSNASAIVVSPTTTTTYSVTGINGSCSGNASITLTVSASGGPVSVISSTTAGCGNACFGMVTATTNGGTAPYTYSLSGSTCSSLPCTNLCAGIYKLYTSDINGCSTFNLFSISNSANNLQVSFSSTNASCPTCTDGIIIANSTGGIAPFNYTWSPIGGNASIAANLIPGCYTVSIQDAVSCVLSARSCLGALTNLAATAIDETNLLVFPNPARHTVSVQYEGAIFNVLVYNNLGQLVVSKAEIENATNINTSKLARGVYFMEVKFRDASFRKKLILE